MRILIVGNDPNDIDGVSNYTRPLASKFAELNHTVFYFYSGAYNMKYDWRIRPYLKISRGDFRFECAELVNSPHFSFNYGDPLMDVGSTQTERLFLNYIKKRKPDVMHLHSRLGLPVSIVELAARQGIKVFNTIHVYGMLCQKRVMIDNNGRLCSGPSDLEKCVNCPEPENNKGLKLRARILNTNKDLLSLLSHMKKSFIRKNVRAVGHPQKLQLSSCAREKAKEGLRKRLNYMIALMNHHILLNICVSTDVKRTLLRYGVKEDKLLVQHIGSLIAEDQRRETRELHNPIVIGNIGGVGYYKGIHVLLEAVSILKNHDFILKIFGKYDSEYVSRIIRGREDLPIEFLGRYKPEDLPAILAQIDIMVLPSICSDTAPQTIFESYSAGIPIIASNIGGFPDFIEDGVNGYLFRPGDSQDLANKLNNVLTDPLKIKSFVNHIPRLKTITENAQELLSLYESH